MSLFSEIDLIQSDVHNPLSKLPRDRSGPITMNMITLLSYELKVDEYIGLSPKEVSGGLKEWIDRTLSFIDTRAHILEVGSASGRDAQYMESLGFSVERTDAAEGFVSRLNQMGYRARQFNALTDELSEKYELIFANAVFLHFSYDELQMVLKKIFESLQRGGILSFSVKYGEGEIWTEEKIERPRYYLFWKEYNIKLLLELVCFEVLNISQDREFLEIIARKN